MKIVSTNIVETIASAQKNAIVVMIATAHTRSLKIKRKSEESDENLMVGYQKGSLEDFDLLYKRHSGRVYGYLKNRLKNVSSVDDVFQAVFLKLHKNRMSYDPRYPFLAWLFTLTKNILFDHLRKNKSDRLIFDEAILEKAHAPSEEKNGVDNSSLLPKERQVLDMRYSADMPFEAIAEKLGTSPVNIRQMVSRAVKKLRRQV